VWFEADHVRLWTRTLDHLPKSAVWTNATYHIWSDIVESLTNLEVTRVGTQLKPRHCTYLHYRHPDAVRGGYGGKRKILTKRTDGTKVGNPEFVQVAREAVRLARARWYAEGGEGVPRILLATYKAICDLGVGDGPESYAREVGASALDYYERLVGCNDYAGWEILVMLGEPNPGISGQEAAITALYPQLAHANLSPGIRQRMSCDTLAQCAGRIRPVASELPQVIMAVTPLRPAIWGDNAEIVPESLHARILSPNLDIWESVFAACGCGSKKFARAYLGGILGLSGAMLERVRKMSLATAPTDTVGRVLASVAPTLERISKVRPGEWRMHTFPDDRWIGRACANVCVPALQRPPRARQGYALPDVDLDVAERTAVALWALGGWMDYSEGEDPVELSMDRRVRMLRSKAVDALKTCTDLAQEIRGVVV
jgi:hypothetical protein